MGKSLAIKAEIVTLRGSEPFTTSLAIAEGVGLPHASVIKLIRKHRERIERFGPCRFEIYMASRKQGGGRPLEFVEFNEDQATFLMTLFKNSAVVLDFKERLVKAFRKALNEITRLTKQQREPAWQLVRDETRVGFKWMQDAVKEQREASGKETCTVHYMAEAKLINGVLTGRFTAIERNQLSASDLLLLADLQRRNAMLIARDVPYGDRKAALAHLADEKRQALTGREG